MRKLRERPYCLRCGIPHAGRCIRDAKTLPEQLDAAQSGEQFGQVLTGFFAALDKARWEEEDDE